MRIRGGNESDSDSSISDDSSDSDSSSGSSSSSESESDSYSSLEEENMNAEDDDYVVAADVVSEEEKLKMDLLKKFPRRFTLREPVLKDRKL